MAVNNEKRVRKPQAGRRPQFPQPSSRPVERKPIRAESTEELPERSRRTKPASTIPYLIAVAVALGVVVLVMTRHGGSNQPALPTAAKSKPVDQQPNASELNARVVAESLRNDGNRLVDFGRFDEAKRKYDAANALVPNSAPKTYEEITRLWEAMEAARQARAINEARQRPAPPPREGY